MQLCAPTLTCLLDGLLELRQLPRVVFLLALVCAAHSDGARELQGGRETRRRRAPDGKRRLRAWNSNSASSRSSWAWSFLPLSPAKLFSAAAHSSTKLDSAEASVEGE